MHTSGASALSPPHSAPGAGRPAGAGGGVMRELSIHLKTTRGRNKGYQDNKIIDSRVAAVNHQRRYLYVHAFVLLKSSKSGQK